MSYHPKQFARFRHGHNRKVVSKDICQLWPWLLFPPDRTYAFGDRSDGGVGIRLWIFAGQCSAAAGGATSTCEKVPPSDVNTAKSSER
jgi:hypothetical protein